MENRNIEVIGGIACYEEQGTAYLDLETVAKGLGFTKKANSGNEVVNWTRVRGYLADLGVVQMCTTGDYIPENIFYRLAMKAKNATAEKFQAFVADEVIPSIRRHGAYMTPSTMEQAIADPDFAIGLLSALKKEQEHRKELEAECVANRPKALFADAVSASKTSILVGDLAKLLKQNGVDVGQKRLFHWLRENGYLMKQKGASWNMPTQKSMEAGWFEVKETSITHSDGHISISRTVKVTGKGQIYFINKLLRQWH